MEMLKFYSNQISDSEMKPSEQSPQKHKKIDFAKGVRRDYKLLIPTQNDLGYNQVYDSHLRQFKR